MKKDSGHSYQRRPSSQQLRRCEPLAIVGDQAAILSKEQQLQDDLKPQQQEQKNEHHLATVPSSPSSCVQHHHHEQQQKATLRVTDVSRMKSMMIKVRRRMQKKMLRTAIVAEEDIETQELEEPANLLPLANPTATISIGKSMKSQSHECQPIVTFETRDSKWKAVIDGDIEQFMYPSLRLETLYTSASEPTLDRNTHSQNKKHDAALSSIPSAEQVGQVLASATKVKWEVERRYQNATQSGPVDGHPRVTDSEYKRLQFDKQLERAEALLQKQEMAELQTKRLYDLQYRAKTATTTANTVVKIEPEDEEVLAAKRRRASSLYRPHVIPNQQMIPRLPQTRKIIKEIQRHTTNQGQIKYYANKQNLFTKWKKLQLSQLHQLPPQSLTDPKETDEKSPSLHSNRPRSALNTQPFEEDDDTQQPYGALSPRSLFYHECVKHQVLPEPIFSRIHEESVTTPLSLNPTSFTSVAATLVQAVHDRNTEHEDLVTMPNGRIVTKKHHLALHLQHFGLGDEKTNALSKSLQHFHSIHVLDLSNNRLTDTSIISLLQSLEIAWTNTKNRFGSLPRTGGSSGAKHRLSMTLNHVGSAYLNRKGNELKVLNLSQNEIGRAGCAQIARFLGICCMLTHLDLSHTNLSGDEALAPLTTAIECHPTLQHVNLSYNKIGEKGGLLLGNMITQPTCMITELNISWNQICRSGAMAIGEALRTNTAMKTLNLAMNRFGDEGGEQLAAAMAANTSLTALDLSRNAIGGASAVAFGYFLRQNTSLRHLQLQDNSLGSIGAKALFRAVAMGSRCEIHLSVHDIETSVEKDTVFDTMLPSLASPYELKLGESPYACAVANELFDAALRRGSCLLSELSFTDNQNPKKLKKINLVVDVDAQCVYDSATRKPWKLPNYGILYATAIFTPSPMPKTTPNTINEEVCLALIRIIKRGFSPRDIVSLLDLVLSELFLTTQQANFFVTHLKGTVDLVEVIGRLWPCLIDGANVFQFLQTHLKPVDQRRLIDVFGASTIQFTTANPTGRWCLDLSDCRQRKIVLWFTMINAFETAQSARYHPKRTDSSQYGKGLNWRNVHFNRKAIRLTYDFFTKLPRSGILEFDFVSTVRHEDQSAAHKLTDDELDQLINQVGAEVCSIYIPVHKRKDIKYQLVLLHLAIADNYLTCQQAHHVMQHFPKNYDKSRLKVILAVHRMLIDLENFGELLERLVVTDRRKVYTSLGYLNTLNPLHVDMDYDVDFEREDEKMVLRALVDLSMACPMDMIRIESERSDVVVIYSMYQTNSVPSTGKIFFRYVSHVMPKSLEWLKNRQLIYRYFLCGDRLKALGDAALNLSCLNTNLSAASAAATAATGTASGTSSSNGGQRSSFVAITGTM